MIASQVRIALEIGSDMTAVHAQRPYDASSRRCLKGAPGLKRPNRPQPVHCSQAALHCVHPVDPKSRWVGVKPRIELRFELIRVARLGKQAGGTSKGKELVT